MELVLPEMGEFPPPVLMAMEKELTGLYLSGHPMDAYRASAQAQGAVAIGALVEGLEDGAYQDGQRVTIAGVVSASKTKTTRNNSLMAYVTVEDDTGSIELLAFARVLEESGSYLQEGSPILVNGRISVREEKAPQLMCDRVTSLTQVPEGPRETAPMGVLYLRFAGDGPLLGRVKDLFQLFPGQNRAVLYLQDSGRRLGASCLLHEALLRELVELMGEENVIVKG